MEKYLQEDKKKIIVRNILKYALFFLAHAFYCLYVLNSGAMNLIVSTNYLDL